ncbi:M1 family metallopeptidase [Rapidithrix thailandica]|uniref:M1 family metallopeptidase n=1 Tax=Rapidithrix thailandica TaxID=413964 RepID=A0AAW9S8N9_9BACT
MKKALALIFAFAVCWQAYAQERQHSDKFEQLGPLLRSPNKYRTASGAPGPEYWQNQADYEMDIELNDDKQSITGHETITYTNHSPDPLTYLWVQLDQNVRAKDSDSYSTANNSMRPKMNAYTMGKVLPKDFDGGFKINAVKDVQGKDLPYTINKTMMRIDLPKTLYTGDQFAFQIDWYFNINDRMELGGRSGYEYFEKDDNYLYTIAQFFPRMCVYNDYEGWQNKQFLGSGEFSLPFGDYKVSITVPEDHIVGATGKLQNPVDVLSYEQMKLLKDAETAKDPVMIVSQKEAQKKEKKKLTGKKTWVFHAEDVRDFAFASSRKFIWDAMGVNIGGKTIMAMSYYPKEGNPLWEKYSTRVVAHTLKVYSKHTIDYPYHKAISVNAARIGMEYPMICFNYGRCDEKGNYTDRTKYGMIGVIIHEVGHNFFPMIINSDERQWTWMDEGLNTFVEYLTEVAFEDEFGEPFPASRAKPQNIVPYMNMSKKNLSPIMTNSEQIQNFGPNAYTKPATALNILRETVMGRDLFDVAFKEYSQRWAFKHPTPTDFFRTMEDASAVDLDWFWRGWFYTVDHVDVSLDKVVRYKFEGEEGSAKGNIPEEELDDPEKYQAFYGKLEDKQKAQIKDNTNFYELSFTNKGGLVMPVILEFTYEDGSNELIKLPAEVWRYNDENISKVFVRNKKITNIALDPMLETADTDMSNNYWPKKTLPSRFKMFKEKTGK